MTPDTRGLSAEDAAKKLEQVAGVSNRKLSAALLLGAAALRQTTWQPIATAPKEGWVLLVESDGEPIVGGYVDFGDDVPKGYKNGWFDNATGRYEITPTHWMPLPAPPVAEGETR